ncbi:Cysteine protease Prp [Popillia japonica]|uniref:Cysteine protease Prp n=1 Tax=Popillia japonica TaxID=7064 RepID=A0AAW1HUW7_POPJA
MISVKPKKNSLTVSGHAGYAEKGKDIVCAGVSTLWNTLVESTARLTTDNIYYGIAEGEASMEWNAISEKGELLIGSFLIGVKELEAEYPEYVKIV